MSTDGAVALSAGRVRVGGARSGSGPQWPPWVEQSAGKNEFARALAAAGVDAHAALQESGSAIRARLAELLAGAQRAGAVRPELGPPEVIALLVGTTTTMEHLGNDAAARERVFAVVFDGLRPR